MQPTRTTRARSSRPAAEIASSNAAATAGEREETHPPPLQTTISRDTERSDPRATHPQSTHRPAPAHEWRHGDQPTVRPDHFDRPVGERELVRHKTFAPGDLTVEEALFDMEMLDYDFFLFRESSTGADAVLWRVDDALHLRVTGDAEPDVGTTGAALDPDEVAESSVRDALERLDAGGEPFVFFRNRVTSEANVAYRRYDGHYGLLTPAR